MLEKPRNKLILGRYKLKEGILNLFVSEKRENLKIYKDFLNKNLKILKRINTTSTRVNIEINLNKKTSFPAFDWQEEIVSLNNIFAMMLGIIDARKASYEKELGVYETFNEINEIRKIDLEQKKLSESRVKIIQDYESICEEKDMQIIKQAIKCVPSYKNFDKLFEDMKENSYNLVIQGQLISAYMF